MTLKAKQPDPGLDVWELHTRPIGSVQDFQPSPFLNKRYRFVKLADAEETVRRLLGRRLEVQIKQGFMPFVKALVESYCEQCGAQTANEESARSTRHTVSACRDCRLKLRTS